MKRTSALFLLLLALLAGLFFVGYFKKTDQNPAFERPNDPFVFRSVLDKTPRMLTLALSDDVWAAYSTDSCSLYKVWKGGVDFDGAVYTMRHGPQPMSIGRAWTVNAHRQPWRIELGGRSEKPSVEWRGHRLLKNGGVELQYDLALSDGKKIRVNERPEAIDRAGQIGFERVFRVENLPEGAKIYLESNAQSLADASGAVAEGGFFSIKSQGKMQSEGVFAVETDGVFEIQNPKSSALRMFFVRQPLVENPNDAELLAEAAQLSAGERLINKSDCRTCHNPTEKTVGPAYAEIARRYANTPENVAKLIKKVKLGGGGVWGQAAMSPHPDVSDADLQTIVSYVMDFDKGNDMGEGKAGEAPAGQPIDAAKGLDDTNFAPGLAAAVFQGSKPLGSFKNWNEKAKPAQTGTVEAVYFLDPDFAAIGLSDNFQAKVEGYLSLPEDMNLDFRLSSDDGSRMWIADKVVIDNDGYHGMEPKDANLNLKKGLHKIRIDFWQGGGGKSISLEWAKHGDIDFKPVPPQFFVHVKPSEPETRIGGGKLAALPGDGMPLTKVHPSFDLAQARPDWFLPKVGGMDFDSKGNLFVSTWDATGAVYKISNVRSGNPARMKCVRVAAGLAEPLGLKVVNDELFVLQKQELTRLRDLDGDGQMDEYEAFARGWKASANFHEFAFGLAYKDGFFYATLAIAIMPGGASARPQIPDRGKVVKIDAKTGQIEFIANGLRTPNGVGVGPDGEIFVADNQGDWLPSSKILHVKPGAFFGSFAVDSAANSLKPITLPVAWLPQDEIGNSPTQPALLNVGPYQNQLIFGDVCYGGLQRLFVEKIDGEYQGCVFRFTQGLEGGTNRLAWGPDGALYVGMIGNPGNWGQAGKLWYGLQKLSFNDKTTFEMLSVRALSDGLEVEFTEPLSGDDALSPTDFFVDQWRYVPTPKYGGPKVDQEKLNVRSVAVLDGGKKIHLQIDGIKPERVVHLKLRNSIISANDQNIWQTEAWYTMNRIPSGKPAVLSSIQTSEPPAADNELSQREAKQGWKLLFDGKSFAGWRNFKKQTIGKDWIIDDGAIHLDAKKRTGAGWQADGGDLVSADEFENFELKLDWKIGPCGNSGIFYNVSEASEYEYGWQTGPEMQVLDNSCHPDAKIEKHRAGDLYDMIACENEVVRPAGEWNNVRIVSKNGHVQHWLNGRKVVEFQMFGSDWKALIARSKFKDMKGFGTHRRGHISLQDHGDMVWFKNIKIRTF